MAVEIEKSKPLTSEEHKQILQRYSALDTEASSWISHWQDINRVLLPRAGRFLTTDRNRGEKRYNDIYDSAGGQALKVLGAGMMSGATSPARPWFNLAPGDRDLLKSQPVQEWLYEVRAMMLDIFNKTNTYRTLHQKYEEGGAFGTSASILMESFEKVVEDYPLTIGEYRLGTDYMGNVNTITRRFEQTVGAMIKEFGLNNVTRAVKTLYDNGNYDAPVTIIHMLQPREFYDGNKADAANMPYQSVYFEEGANNDQTLRNSGMRQFRALTPRWWQTPGDVYGYGPGMVALGDIKQLQHEQLAKAKAIDYQVNPPLNVPTSMKNDNISTLPGGVNYFDAIQGSTGGISSAFQVNLDLRYLLADIQDVRGRIDAAFFKDIFLMISTNQSGPQQTATEIAEKHEEKMLMLGPVLENLHHEELRPRVLMTFERLVETDLLPPPPPELEGQQLDIEFVSVLAQAQRAVSTGSVDKFVIGLGQIAQMKPGVLDKFDSDKWVDEYSQMTGIPPSIIVSGPKVALIREKRAAQAAQAKEQEQMAAGVDAAQKLGNTPTDTDNALTGLQGYTRG